jgi:hypothetical protein
MLDKYDYESNTESNKILSLIVEKTFDGFEKLIDKTGRNNNFLDCINKINIIDVSSVNYENLFVNAVNEVLQTKNNVLNDISGVSLSRLSSVGLTGSSLNLKNQLFREKLFKLNELIGRFADFTNNNHVNAFIEDLENLLNILDSLQIVIAPLEPLIEMIKALISLLKQLKN